MRVESSSTTFVLLSVFLSKLNKTNKNKYFLLYNLKKHNNLVIHLYSCLKAGRSRNFKITDE